MKLKKVLFGLSIATCAPGVLVAKPAPVIDATSANVAEVSYTSTGSVTEQLANIERKLDAKNKAQIKVLGQLGELQDEVDELRGVTEYHSHQLSQILERQRELYQELDRRVSEALKPQAPVINQQSLSEATPSTDYSEDVTENEAYDHAVNLVLKEKKYEQAIPEFRAFNLKYPESIYAANSHYWLGQLLFSKGDLANAKIEFATVADKFSKSTKRGDALLKLAMVEQKEKNNDKAISLYQQLINEYPGSSAALLAKPKLDSLQR